MNSRQWRKCGYKTIFVDARHGAPGPTVILFVPIIDVVISAPVDGGRWMEHNNVNKPPWHCNPKGLSGENPQIQARLKKIKEVCYCDQGCGTCDFCAGVRDP